MQNKILCFNEELIPCIYGDVFEEEFSNFLNYPTDKLIDTIYEKLKYLGIKLEKLYLINGSCRDYILFSSLKSSYKNTILLDKIKDFEVPRKLRSFFDFRPISHDIKYENILLTYISDIDENGNLTVNLKDYSLTSQYHRPLLLDATHIVWDPRVNKDKLVDTAILLVNLSPWLLIYPKYYLLIIPETYKSVFNMNYLEKFRVERAGKVILALISYRLEELFANGIETLYKKTLSYSSYLITKLINRRELEVHTDLDEIRRGNIVVLSRRDTIDDRICLKRFGRCFIYLHYKHSFKDIDFLVDSLLSNTAP